MRILVEICNNFVAQSILWWVVKFTVVGIVDPLRPLFVRSDICSTPHAVSFQIKFHATGSPFAYGLTTNVSTTITVQMLMLQSAKKITCISKTQSEESRDAFIAMFREPAKRYL